MSLVNLFVTEFVHSSWCIGDDDAFYRRDGYHLHHHHDEEKTVPPSVGSCCVFTDVTDVIDTVIEWMLSVSGRRLAGYNMDQTTTTIPTTTTHSCTTTKQAFLGEIITRTHLIQMQTTRVRVSPL